MARLIFSKMVLMACIFMVLPVITNGQSSQLLENNKSPYVKLKNVGIKDVKWSSGFWGDRVNQSENTMIPYMQEIYMDRALKNFKIAAGLEQGEFAGSWWQDGDFYKWVEALVISYADTKDKKIDAQLDNIISILGKAQDKDGYINTAIQIGHGKITPDFDNTRSYKDITRWSGEQQHEIYNFGHLFTLAAIHYRVTGKISLLNIAEKAADYLYIFFKNPDPKLASLLFNEPQIMGLVELYRSTNNQKYLDLSNTFLDLKAIREGKPYQTQDNVPVRQIETAVGHAVTGMYLYSGMADVYSETGDTSLLIALKRLWEDVTEKKMYITGGVGSYHRNTIKNQLVHEAFGKDYDLPNSTAYNETCANIANGMFNWRMLGITGEEKYADIMERVFYNSLLSSIGLEGKSYFYTNVLRWHGHDHELLSQDAVQRWNVPRGGICCPPNTVRTIQEIGNYVYSVGDKGIWVNLYGANSLTTTLLNGSLVELTQLTNYPWDEEVKIIVNKTSPKPFSLMLRIPQWAEGATVKVNGKKVTENTTTGSYFEVNRKWKKGDVVELTLPMKVQMIQANSFVEANAGKIALQRGPVVYCLESVDMPLQFDLSDVSILKNSGLKPVFKKDVLGGVTVLEGKIECLINQNQNKDSLYSIIENEKTESFPVQFVPYYSWNNRGIGEMAVWMPVK